MFNISPQTSSPSTFRLFFLFPYPTNYICLVLWSKSFRRVSSFVVIIVAHLKVITHKLKKYIFFLCFQVCVSKKRSRLVLCASLMSPQVLTLKYDICLIICFNVFCLVFLFVLLIVCCDTLRGLRYL